MDYLYYKVQDAAFRADTPQRRAFRVHLQLVAQALHDIEWVDSGDCSSGDENKAIMACLGPNAVLEQLLKEAQQAADLLVAEIALVKGTKT